MSKSLKDEKIKLMLRKYRTAYSEAQSVLAVNGELDLAELSLLQQQIDKIYVKALKQLFEDK